MGPTIVPQEKSAPSHQREPSLTLELSPVLYTAAWMLIVLFHAACGTFLIFVAMAYRFLTTDTMTFFVSMWSLKGTEHYRFYGVMFGIVDARRSGAEHYRDVDPRPTTSTAVGDERDSDSDVEADDIETLEHVEQERSQILTVGQSTEPTAIIASSAFTYSNVEQSFLSSGFLRRRE
ncbi:hypothetical protein PF001_g30742 [Phytophthora fragariae]|uniref:Uncharacterized protein n=1 Tax=Phytophthora fragariae TaxID=53985 RepID=A0A6A3GTE1_9STRA|nr:hypothetical protein PF003_g35669 [Phytophthora fragariae]KAE8960198.1 hypothetical protein PF011_g30173 [Phytophthora fragariae]KAE9064275.1 hypothetical protein PF006_g30741 [Phytophthora fragariae]KAE9163337.1 hypothetical protein PF004_g30175 [Phytophthora fragariae]KAE9265789.1 hypothetical protein PF001_g30742 [Phytophthora fragariae]